MIRKTCEGFAPLAALLAIVALGAAITGGFYALSHDRRVEHADLAAQAVRVAEVGLQEALDGWMMGDAQRPSPTPVTVYRSASGAARASYTVEVRPAGRNLTLVRSEGRVQVGEREVVRVVSTLVSSMKSSSGLRAER